MKSSPFMIKLKYIEGITMKTHYFSNKIHKEPHCKPTKQIPMKDAELGWIEWKYNVAKLPMH